LWQLTEAHSIGFNQHAAVVVRSDHVVGIAEIPAIPRTEFDAPSVPIAQ
jgi:hypothetical protein